MAQAIHYTSLVPEAWWSAEKYNLRGMENPDQYPSVKNNKI